MLKRLYEVSRNYRIRKEYIGSNLRLMIMTNSQNYFLRWFGDVQWRLEIDLVRQVEDLVIEYVLSEEGGQLKPRESSEE